MSKVAFVTGGARGIGKAISLRLARDGFNVAVTDLKSSETAGQEVVAEILKLGRQSAFFPVDVTDAKSIGAAVTETNKVLNGFDVMVNNAGICIPRSIADTTTDDLAKLFNVNVNGVLFGIQEATKMFQQLGHGGKIINASSLTGHLAVPGLAAYSASKFAVKGITQAAAQELAPLGITVNAYCPGTTETPMLAIFSDTEVEGATAPKDQEQAAVAVPSLRRVGQPEEIAGLVSFLALNDSSYINGQAILADGGAVFP